MKVTEARDLVKKYSESDLQLLAVEMYKAIPKKVREEKNIDEMLQDINGYVAKSKIRKKQVVSKNMDELQPEIEEFIDYAYKQYYLAPNRYIPKKERPKWRFKVKSYIKDLETFPTQGSDGESATELLKKLYEILCYACGYYIFNTEEPFRSVGIEQSAFFELVMKRLLGNGINKDMIKTAVGLIIDNHVDYETLPSNLMVILISNLQTTDMKEAVIEQSKVIKGELTPPNKKSGYLSTEEIRYENKNNNITELIFRVQVSLCDYEEAIKYFKTHYLGSRKEVSLYVLLQLLQEYDLPGYWLKEYESAAAKGIDPRNSLLEIYKYLVKNKKFPDYWI